MYKPIPLLGAILCALLSYSQKTDTLIIHYPPDQFVISKQDKQRLDSFLLKTWDRISINGYTDETEGEEYNLELSKRRSGEVYRYFTNKNIAAGILSSQYFGESMPKADNGTDEGKTLNRRTEIIGYRFARITLKPKEDPMKPVTTTLDNGFIITYRPGSLPDYFAANLSSGSSMNFRVIENTEQMRQNNLYNNTTNGEILSSMMIISFDQLTQCKLDSPVLLRVPVPYQANCNIQKLKFFVSVWKNGQRIWEEQNKTVFPERINGITYACVWVDSFCGSVNFDFKIPECFDTDSSNIYVKANIKALTAEIKGVNCVYLPEKVNDSTNSILFLKNKPGETALSFSLYNGKKRIRSFWDQALTTLPYDETTNQYLLSTGTYKFYFPDLKLANVALKVNRDRYVVFPENDKCEITYLNHKTETVLVSFTVIGRKKEVTIYKNQPLRLLPYDESTGYYIIDKEFLKTLKQVAYTASR